MDKIIFTVKELAEYLNCSESCIRKLKQEQKIPSFRLGKKIMFDKGAINEWINVNQIRSIEMANNNVEVKVYE